VGDLNHSCPINIADKMSATSGSGTVKYFNDPRGDFYFITSEDEVVFRVSKSTVSYCSTVFAEMFDTVDQHQPLDNKDGTEAHPLELHDCDARTLDAILRMIYPGRRPPIERNMALMVNCIKFTKKYLMEETVDPILQEIILHPSFLKEHPFDAFVLASTLGWEGASPDSYEVALAATLCRDVQDINHDQFKSSVLFDLLDVRSLLKLSNAHREKMQLILTILAYFTDYGFWYNSAWSHQKCACNPDLSGREVTAYIFLQDGPSVSRMRYSSIYAKVLIKAQLKRHSLKLEIS